MPLPVELFEEKVLSGDLRGVKGDLNASTNISRYEKKCLLIEHGLCTELYDAWVTDDPKSPDYDLKIQYKLVEHGYDHYEEWKDHPDENVRLSLATNGYFLDHYIHDIDDRIKYAAVSLQPELMIDLLANPTDDELRFARDYLYDQWSPDVEHLKAYLDAAHADEEPKDYKAQALLTKYLSNVVGLDALAKTMTSAQLFTVNHPAWARGYEPEAIATIDTIVRALQRAGYTTKNAYADILFAIADEYKNDSYHYYLEFCADAIQTIKERVRPDTH